MYEKDFSMSDILSQLWTPELQMAVTVCIVMLVAVYVLSIIWVVRDAYQRGTVWYIWGHRRARSHFWASSRIACFVRRCCKSIATSKSSRSR